jgi:hypothetical protein
MHIVLQCTCAGGARRAPSAPSPPPRRPWPPARGRRRRLARVDEHSTAQPSPTHFHLAASSSAPARGGTPPARRSWCPPRHVHRPTQRLAAGEEGRKGGSLERVGPRRNTALRMDTPPNLSSLCCLLMEGSSLFLSLSLIYCFSLHSLRWMNNVG